MTPFGGWLGYFHLNWNPLRSFRIQIFNSNQPTSHSSRVPSCKSSIHTPDNFGNRHFWRKYIRATGNQTLKFVLLKKSANVTSLELPPTQILPSSSIVRLPSQYERDLSSPIARISPINTMRSPYSHRLSYLWN